MYTELFLLDTSNATYQKLIGQSTMKGEPQEKEERKEKGSSRSEKSKGRRLEGRGGGNLKTQDILVLGTSSCSP